MEGNIRFTKNNNFLELNSTVYDKNVTYLQRCVYAVKYYISFVPSLFHFVMHVFNESARVIM